MVSDLFKFARDPLMLGEMLISVKLQASSIQVHFNIPWRGGQEYS